MHLPRVIKGIVKSTAFFLSYVIVKSHIARSAFCETEKFIKSRMNRYYRALSTKLNTAISRAGSIFVKKNELVSAGERELVSTCVQQFFSFVW